MLRVVTELIRCIPKRGNEGRKKVLLTPKKVNRKCVLIVSEPDILCPVLLSQEKIADRKSDNVPVNAAE